MSSTPHALLSALEHVHVDGNKSYLDLVVYRVDNHSLFALFCCSHIMECSVARHVMERHNSKAGRVGVRSIARALKVDFSITEVNLTNAGITSGDIYALAASQSLSSINLSNNNLGDGETYVKSSTVEASSFNIGDKVFYQGREMIVVQGKDGFGDIKMKPAVRNFTGITAIADIIRASHSPNTIIVSWNELGVEGAKALAPAIRDSHSLKQVCAMLFSLPAKLVPNHSAPRAGQPGRQSSMWCRSGRAWHIHCRGHQDHR